MHKYRRIFLLIFFSFALVPALVIGQDEVAQIDNLLKSYHDYGQFNGSVLVADKGQVIYKKGIGYANMEWKIPNETDTKFRLASITKQFTAALILQLVEQGKIKLDGKITDYLPDYRKDTGDRVTVHHLLNHTSGIPSYTDDPAFFPEKSRKAYTVNDFVKQMASGDILFEPGSKFAYNNSGYFLLGAIIEKVTGKTYEQAIKESIFEPLGMKNSGYDRADTIIAKRASGYGKTPSGYINTPYLDMSLPYAAGSLYSTVEDMYLWDQALYTDKIISAKSRDLMFKPGLENYGYGFTMGTIKLPNGSELQNIQHSGGINGFSTLIVRLVEGKQLIVLLDNTEQGRNLGAISRNIAFILHGQEPVPPKRSLVEALTATATEKGAEAVLKQYRELKATQPNVYDFREAELNALGYILLRNGKAKDAIEVLKYNVELFPASANPYDSLGEAYALSGEKEQAIKSYKKALEIDPKFPSSIEALKRLELPAVTVNPKLLEQYVGQYRLAPTFILTVTAENGTMFVQATNQPKIPMQPTGEGQFFVTGVNATITFAKDAGGAITSLTLDQGGRKQEAKRIP